MDRGGTITWYLDADDSDFENTTRRVEERSRVTAKVVDKEFEKGTKGANKSLARFRAELAETASVVRNFEVATRGFNMTSIAIAAVAASGAVVELAAALTGLSGLFLSVPAFVGVGIAAFGTVKTAVQGMGDAFEAVVEGDMEDLAEAMEKLSPSAREVVKAFQGINDKFKEIQQVVQQEFFKDLGAEMEKMGKVYLPILKDGLKENAIAMNGFLKEVAAVSREPFFTGAVSDIMSQTATNTTILTRAIEPLALGLASLIKVGLPYTEMLSEWIVKQSELFGAYASSAEGQERFNIALENGKAALFIISNLFGNIIELFYTLFEVSITTGLQLVSTISGIIQSMTDWLKSAEGLRQWNALLYVTNEIIKELADIVGTALGFIFDMVEAFRNLSDPVRGVIVSMLAWIAILTPVITYLSAMRGSLETVKDMLFSVAGVFGGPLAAAGLIAVAALGGLAFALGGTSDSAQAFQDFFAGIPGMISAFVAGLPAQIAKITEVVQGIITQLLAGLPMLIEVGTKILLALIDGIIVALPLIIQAAIDIGIQLLEGLVKALPAILDAGVKIVLALVNGLLQALPKIIEMIPRLIMAIITAIVTALPLLLDAGVQILTGILNGIISALPSIITAVVSLITTLIAFLAQNAGMIIEAGLKMVNALLDGIIGALDLIVQGAITIVVALVTALIENIPVLIPAIVQLVLAIAWALITNAPLIIEALVKIIFLMIGGIISRIPLVVGAIGKLMLGLLGKMGSHADDFLIAAFNLIIKVANGIGNAAGNVMSAIGRIISDMLSVPRNAVGSFLNAGGDLIRGLVNGISNSRNAVINKVKEIASGALDAIKNFFGIKSPSRVMAQMGVFLMEGFSIGIDKTADMAVKAAESAADAVMGAFGAIDAGAMNASQAYTVNGAMVPATVVAPDDIQLSRGSSNGATINQTNIVNTDLDMNQVNRNLTWELNKL